MLDQPISDKSLYIQKRYPISNEEFDILQTKYGKLCWFAATKLAASNKKCDDDLQDYHAEISISMYRAGSYYKRQTFIENAFEYLNRCKIYIATEDMNDLINLQSCWNKKANFYEQHEDKLLALVNKYGKNPNIEMQTPDPTTKLVFDDKFSVYCKSILWNASKNIGQNISKENHNRVKEVSLDEWGFLEGGDSQRIHDEGVSYNPHHYHEDFQVVRNRLSGMEDQRPLKTFDIILDPKNHDSVFKQNDGKKEGLKINVVRKETCMSYRTINKQLKIIKKIIEEELGVKFAAANNRVICKNAIEESI